VGDTNTAKTDSLKVLDPKRPIREADIVSKKQHAHITLYCKERPRRP